MIPKASEIADMLLKNLVHYRSGCSWEDKDLERIVSVILTDRKAVLEEAARRICPLCRKGVPVDSRPGVHTDITHICDAQPIYQLIEEMKR